MVPRPFLSDVTLTTGSATVLASVLSVAVVAGFLYRWRHKIGGLLRGNTAFRTMLYIAGSGVTLVVGWLFTLSEVTKKETRNGALENSLAEFCRMDALHVLTGGRLVVRAGAGGAHLDELRIELAEDLDQIGLRGHDGEDVLIAPRHFIEAGAELLFGRRHSPTRSERAGGQV